VSDRQQSPAHSLRERGLSPRKRQGQNFLKDRRFLDRILDAAAIGPEDTVLEIGAGTGVLTRAVAARARRVLAVELDDNLVRLLGEETRDQPGVEIWHGNALDLRPEEHFDGPYKLVGNIPYYITGPIVRHFLECRLPPSVLVLMVQREVAERMCAGPGSLSLLGLAVQFYAEPSIVTRVPAGAFYPPPKVESAIIRLTPRTRAAPPEETEDFFLVARAGFGTKRKTLANGLRIGLQLSRAQAEEVLSAASVDGRTRAQDLSLDDWRRLAHAYRSLREET
jgi:16S rRNA (adenine1518-N6/adenine1519-N6)-dimethyltransferase